MNEEEKDNRNNLIILLWPFWVIALFLLFKLATLITFMDKVFLHAL